MKLKRNTRESKNPTGRSEHVTDGLRNHGGFFIDYEFEALGAD